MFLIRDEKHVYQHVARPAAVYDGAQSVLLKIGDYEEMMRYFEAAQKSYREHGLHDVADDLYVMELPHSQEEIDNVFSICDYIGVLHRRIVEGKETETR